MVPISLLPYFHPTSVAFVDDDLDFLSNLSLQLDPELAYRLFDSPYNALVVLNDSTRSRPLSERFFATSKGNSTDMPTAPLLGLDLAAIPREVRNTERFAEFAVVIVDYAMPRMNGLEFCQRINNPHVKKVLFTGIADENLAVRAFNTGIIDRFIRKSDPGVYEEINTTILELQKTYIRDTASTISEVLALRSRDYLIDPVFADFFNHLCQQHGFVEHYISTQPGEFLLLDASGRLVRLVVVTDEELELHGKNARIHGAPQQLLDAITSGDAVPYFDATPDGFFRPECTNWRECLYPAQKLQGRKQYHWALVPNDETSCNEKIASYNDYLDWLDTTAYARL